MRITRTTIATTAAVAALALGVTACHGGNSTNSAIVGSSDTGVEQTMDNNQPAPVFDHSDIRATGIEIEAIEALGENTTSFAITYTGHLLWSCPSLGEPFHADDQITNPEQVDPNTDPGQNNSTSLSLPNMDPNGIYSGPNTGTYVLCVSKTGVPYTHYAEEDMDVVSGPATWDNSTGQVVVSGTPTMPSCAVTNGKTVCTK